MYAKYNTEVSYICLDVNPSIELCLNHQDKVINAIAYNRDGEKLLNVIEHKNKHYEDVIGEILHHDEFQKYLTVLRVLKKANFNKPPAKQRF